MVLADHHPCGSATVKATSRINAPRMAPMSGLLRRSGASAWSMAQLPEVCPRQQVVARLVSAPRGRADTEVPVQPPHHGEVLPGHLFVVGITEDVANELDVLVHVRLIDDGRPGQDVRLRLIAELVVPIEPLHRDVALQPEALAVG